MTFDKKEYMKEYTKKYHKEHKAEMAAANKKYYDNNREEYLRKQRDRKRKWKLAHPDEHKERCRNEITRARKKFLEMYGKECKICGESLFLFLTLDHVNDDGFKNRRKNGTKSNLCEIYDAIREYNPYKFQVLCYNCNCKKANDKYKEKEYSTKKNIVRQREYQKEIKEEFIKMYGGRCNCPGCIEYRIEYLTLDHVQNDGYSRKKNQKEGGMREYREAIKNYRPDVYQILCYNCNCGKERNRGKCPHTN